MMRMFHHIVLAAVCALSLAVNACGGFHATADGQVEACLLTLDSLVSDTMPRQHKPAEGAGLAARYHHYDKLIFDSAYKYAGLCIDSCQLRGDDAGTALWRLYKVRALTSAALFDEATALLDSVNPKDLRPDDLPQYYNRLCVLYLFKGQFAQGTPYAALYNDSVQHYREAVLSTADSTTFLYRNTLANATCDKGDVDAAIAMTEDLLATLTPGTHDYSVAAITLAIFYGKRGDHDRQMLLLAQSATSDIKGHIMETSALRELSAMLFERGDVERAYSYLKRSIADANTYGTRLRNAQAAAIVPHVVEVYESKQQRQQQRITTLLYCMMALVAALVIAFALTLWLQRKLRQANARLNAANDEQRRTLTMLQQAYAQLHETSGIKEQYLARLLALCSTFIEDAHDQWRRASKWLRDGKQRELKTMLTTDNAYAQNTKLFHQNFDAAFLNIYPGFVEAVNALLRPDEQIVVDENERLSSDLRLLALMRLGITDNAQIASILRTNVTTIYSYRSRLRSRAIDKATFEDDVMHIDA